MFTKGYEIFNLKWNITVFKNLHWYYTVKDRRPSGPDFVADLEDEKDDFNADMQNNLMRAEVDFDWSLFHF